MTEIGNGLFILVGVEVGDTEEDMKCSLVNDGPVTIIIDSRIRE